MNKNKANKKIMDVILEIEKTARKNSLPSIGPIKGKIIKNIIKKYKPKRILEIGALHGYSAILMANFVRTYDNSDKKNLDNDTRKEEIIVTSVEVDPDRANISKKNIEKAGLSNKIEVINGDALEVISKLDNQYKFDLIFIDAVKEDYLKYLQYIEKNNLLNKDAVVVADNVLLYEDEMKDYLEYVRNSGHYNSYTSKTSLEFTKNVEDAIEISIQKDRADQE